jgi:hypothetical protein
MSKIAAIVWCAVLGMTMLAACSCSTPTGVARDLIKALEDQDRTGLNRVYCDSSLAELSSRGGPQIRFQDMVYAEQERQGGTAEVEVQGTVRSGDGEVSITWRLKMKKRGGAWCVDSLQSVGSA